MSDDHSHSPHYWVAYLSTSILRALGASSEKNQRAILRKALGDVKRSPYGQDTGMAQRLRRKK